MPSTTKPMMDLRALMEKSADADLLREMIGFAAERLMELEVPARVTAGSLANTCRVNTMFISIKTEKSLTKH